MGFSESDSTKCRRHPNPKQLPGVCSSCLRERLSKLSTSPDSFTNRKKTNNSSDSSSPSFSSASSSSTAATRSRHRRNGSDATYVSVGMVLNNGLKKSRSVSCAPLVSRSCREKMGDGKNNSNIDNMISSTRKKIKNINISSEFKDEEKEGGDNCRMMKKKLGGGFLKKLIHTTSKKTKGALMHSKTMKERSSHSNTTTAAGQN